jgi:hypothetical protein
MIAPLKTCKKEQAAGKRGNPTALEEGRNETTRETGGRRGRNSNRRTQSTAATDHKSTTISKDEEQCRSI